MNSFRTYALVATFAAALMVVGSSSADAQYAYYTPGVVPARTVYSPVSPRRWWRMQRRAFRNTAVVPVVGVPALATTAARVTYSPVTAYSPVVTAYRPVTAYSPVVTAFSPVAAAPCCPTQVCRPVQTCRKVCEPRTTCSYVPQTCYRTQYVNMPVTTMQPATAIDACTGCAVTTMRPVTTLVSQARRVPYTTYRLAFSTVNVERTVCSQTMACSSCATPVSYAAPMAPAPCATGNCATNGVINDAGHIGQPTATPSLSPAQVPVEVNRPAIPTLTPTSDDVERGYDDATTPTSTKPLRRLDDVLPPLPSASDKSAQLPRKASVSLVVLPYSKPKQTSARKLDVSGWE
jgi:hypothetical protein